MTIQLELKNSLKLLETRIDISFYNTLTQLEIVTALINTQPFHSTFTTFS